MSSDLDPAEGLVVGLLIGFGLYCLAIMIIFAFV